MKINKISILRKNLIILLIASFLLVVISYFINNAVKNNKIENKKRLIEVATSRENIFWDCFEKKVYDEQQKWENSQEYLTQKTKYNNCLKEEVLINSDDNRGSGINFNHFLTIEQIQNTGRITRCSSILPDKPWQLHNEIASKYCSEIADNTQDGLLVKKLRKKVPIEYLTDYELSQIVKNNRLKK